MTQYSHKPLSSRKSIRVLELQPGQPGDTLRGKLIEVPLTENTIFDALSYCWGEPKFDSDFICDGKIYQVTKSLATALNHIRNINEPITVWIDQLSIDQTNVDERNSQVQMMGSIFSMARNVLVWLGLSTEASRYLFDCMRAWRFPTVGMQKLMCAVVELYDRPWFERTWTVQEFVLAKHRQKLICGRQRVPWSHFLSYMRRLDSHTRYREHSLPITTMPLWSRQDLIRRQAYHPDTHLEPEWTTTTGRSYADVQQTCNAFNSMESIQRNKSYRTLSRLLMWTYKRQATDLRDKVFGLLGICEFTNERIHVDYSKTTQRVYSEAMARMILDECEFAFFGFSFHSSRTPSLKDLPSWVPDLSDRSHTLPLVMLKDCKPTRARIKVIREALGSAARQNPIASFSDDFRILSTRGKESGLITHVLYPIPGKPMHENWSRWLEWILPLLRGPWSSREMIVFLLKDYISEASMASALQLRNFHLEIKEDQDEERKDDLKDVTDELRQIFFKGRFSEHHFFATDTFHVGRLIARFEKGPEVGDVLARLFEIDLPFVLRKTGDAYTMISMAHVAGHSYTKRRGDEATSAGVLEENALREYSII
ncbi:heterokaryon incompatibility protein-domain-containing protein [Paraphoma chrysanthemicola]|uniref:Heterokaryon incompatibility protein-domain-containing protein n=1 Tax=Paraphoma chrysanthemicola TaxID=798071 RepID=A0A8K0RFX7_9PLEO|nr:heterokaryon incompatibility protein-domain-containing protein [Paraphoma chrysanthemicola]